MQALGVIETRGLIAAIESADVMLKVANVSLLEKTYVGGGIVYIAVTGDVASVKASVEAGTEAVRRMGDNLLISKHTILRPHDELKNIITPINLESKEVYKPEKNYSISEIVELDEIIDPEELSEDSDFYEESRDELNDKDSLENMIIEQGLEKAIDAIKKLKVIELRKIAIEYNNFGLSKKEIAKLGKKLLIEEFEKYYKVNK